ncbi:reverse transcriptase domain-containing protein [Tanacetum coccineum]
MRPLYLRTAHFIDLPRENYLFRNDDQSLTLKCGDAPSISYNNHESLKKVYLIDSLVKSTPQEVLGFSQFLASNNPSPEKEATDKLQFICSELDQPFEIMCDASDYAIGAVLGQRIEKHFRPIHYASKTMTEAETNYTTTEKEMLAVVYAFEKFRSYLIMNKSVVYTDHSALKYLFNKKDAKARLLSWSNFFRIDFKVSIPSCLSMPMESNFKDNATSSSITIGGEYTPIVIQHLQLSLRTTEYLDRVELALVTKTPLRTDMSKITENSQENRQKRTRDRMSDHEAKENHASAFCINLSSTHNIPKPAPALNFVLRVAWLATVFAFKVGLIESLLLNFTLASLEVVRRGHWNYFSFVTLFAVYAILAHISGVFSPVTEAVPMLNQIVVLMLWNGSMFALLSLHLFMYGCNIFSWKAAMMNYNFVLEFQANTTFKLSDDFLSTCA